MSEALVESIKYGFSKGRSQLLLISLVRLFFLLLILGIVLSFHTLQPEFVNFEVLFPVLMTLSATFAISLVFLWFFEKAVDSRVSVYFIFACDAAAITLLIYFSGINQSIFLFLYLINIILSGFVLQRRGAFMMALWTSILFSFLLMMGPELRGQTVFLSIGVNNLAFFAVAGLSGYLSEQINFMGSELQERGRDLRALRNLNRVIIQSIETGMITIDDSGEILQINRAAADLLETSEEEALNRPVSRFWKSLPGLIHAQRFVESEKKSAHVDVEFLASFDRKMVLGLNITPLRNDDSRLTGYVVTFQDLTKIRRLEETMRQSEKLAAVGQLAAGIAHEIRNPLASISGSVQLLNTMLDPSQADEQQLMRITLREIDRLNLLITEFLDFVRPEQSEMHPLDINMLTREVLDLVKVNNKLRPDVKQKVELSDEGRIQGDMNKLKQALLNIVINAYQAMENADEPLLSVESQNIEGRVYLRIRDNGSGMDSKTAKRIFEPFLTTKPKGTGLGLAVTHKIIESHSAKIYVDSQVGVGTEFTLEFPSETAINEVHELKSLAQIDPSPENYKVKAQGTS